MFVLCTEKEASKKQLKKSHKILVSYHLQDVTETKTVSHLSQLVPSVGLIKSFMNGDISRKKYIRKYIKTIEQNDELYASLLMLILAHENSAKSITDRNIALVVSEDELQFGYIQALAGYIVDNFGVPVAMFKDWKKAEFKNKKYKINQEKLTKDIKAYKSLLFDSYDEYQDTKDKVQGKVKDKKKSKDKDKKKYKGKKNKDKHSKKEKSKYEFVRNDNVGNTIDKAAEFDFVKAASKVHIMKIKRKGKKMW